MNNFILNCFKQWINLNRNVQSQFKFLSDESHSNESVEISVYFGVKFYATDPCKLNDESARLKLILKHINLS